MQVEVRTIQKVSDGIMVMAVNLLPRGSGNRAAARRLGRSFKNHELLGPHIAKVVVGASRVTVHFRTSWQLLRLIQDLKHHRNQDVPGQLPLFATS